ncbi:hypothetical protein V6N13_011919 [Hibiscus sabdariffa]
MGGTLSKIKQVTRNTGNPCGAFKDEGTREQEMSQDFWVLSVEAPKMGLGVHVSFLVPYIGACINIFCNVHGKSKTSSCISSQQRTMEFPGDQLHDHQNKTVMDFALENVD